MQARVHKEPGKGSAGLWFPQSISDHVSFQGAVLESRWVAVRQNNIGADQE